jgi:TonB family protein
MTRWLVLVTWLVAASLLGSSPVAAARQDSIAAARELYTTAAYDEALAMLDRLRASTTAAGATRSDARNIEQFRAFCLFALARTTDAEKAIEAAVAIDPTWEIADADAPPRIVALFASVRARAVPSLIRQRFAAAKALHTEKKYDEAVKAFSGLLTLLEHPAIVKVASADLSDLKTVAAGFRDLSTAAAEQAVRAAAPPPAPPPVTTPVTASNATGAGPAAAGSGKPATPQEPVLPPSIITQQIPRPMSMAMPVGESVVIMDLLIDEGGRVERAAIRQSVNRAYEAQLLAASRSWRYTPATQSGKPVKYVKTIEITLTPR